MFSSMETWDSGNRDYKIVSNVLEDITFLDPTQVFELKDLSKWRCLCISLRVSNS